MYTTNPITLEDGRVFDRLSINLSISTSVLSNGQTEVRCAARMVPTTSDGTEKLEDEGMAKSFFLGSVDSADSNTLQTIAEISQAVQTWINAKGF